jgi:hypothetical protein
MMILLGHNPILSQEASGASRVPQVVECLVIKCKALSSNPSTAKKIFKKQHL